MEKYELMLVLKPLLVEDLKEKVLPKIEKVCKDLGGTMELKDSIGKKLLAYEIEKFKEGYYILFTLNLDASKVTEFEKNLKINKDVLRFLVVKEDNL